MVLLVLKAPFEKTQQQNLFPEIMTHLLNIIHRRCWEQFHAGTIYFALSFTMLMLTTDRL